MAENFMFGCKKFVKEHRLVIFLLTLPITLATNFREEPLACILCHILWETDASGCSVYRLGVDRFQNCEFEPIWSDKEMPRYKHSCTTTAFNQRSTIHETAKNTSFIKYLETKKSLLLDFSKDAALAFFILKLNKSRYIQHDQGKVYSIRIASSTDRPKR